MVTHSYIPQRGDFVWLTLDPTRGHEQKGRRPALVLSPIEYNAKAGLILVCPITSQVKGYPFEAPFLFKGVMNAILVDQIRSVDWRERNISFIKKCEQSVMSEVFQKLLLILE